MGGGAYAKLLSIFRRTQETSKFPWPPRFERAQSPGSFGPEPSLEAQIQPSAQRVEPQGSHLRGTATLFRDIFNSELEERIHLPQLTAAQELQIKAQSRLASLMEETLVTRISLLSSLLGGGKTTERLLVRIPLETHKTSPDFDQTAADNAKNRIKQALGEIGCDVFIETDRLPYVLRAARSSAFTNRSKYSRPWPLA